MPDDLEILGRVILAFAFLAGVGTLFIIWLIGYGLYALARALL